MDIEAIRTLRLAEPYRPFYLIMQDGRRLPVERPSFLGISPVGGGLVYASLDGGFDFLNSEQVREAVVDENLTAAPWGRRV